MRDLGCIATLMCLLFVLPGLFSFVVIVLVVAIVVVGIVVLVGAAMAVVDHICWHDRL